MRRSKIKVLKWFSKEYPGSTIYRLESWRDEVENIHQHRWAIENPSQAMNMKLTWG